VVAYVWSTCHTKRTQFEPAVVYTLCRKAEHDNNFPANHSIYIHTPTVQQGCVLSSQESELSLEVLHGLVGVGRILRESSLQIQGMDVLAMTCRVRDVHRVTGRLCNQAVQSMFTHQI